MEIRLIYVSFRYLILERISKSANIAAYEPWSHSFYLLIKYNEWIRRPSNNTIDCNEFKDYQ